MQAIVDVLMYAELRGNTQSFVKFGSSALDREAGAGCGSVVSDDTGACVSVDGARRLCVAVRAVGGGGVAVGYPHSRTRVAVSWRGL